MKSIATKFSRLLIAAASSTMYVIAGVGAPADRDWQLSDFGWHTVVFMACAWLVLTAMIYGVLSIDTPESKK